MHRPTDHFAWVKANNRASDSVNAEFYLLAPLFYVNSDIWAKRNLPLPVPGAVSHDYGWIHFLKTVIPLVYLAKPGNPVTYYFQKMSLFYPSEQESS